MNEPPLPEPDPWSQPVLAATEPASNEARPALPARRLHPLLRAVFYLIAWLVTTLVLQIQVVLIYLLVLTIANRGDFAAAQRGFQSGAGEFPPLPVLALTTASQLLSTLIVTYLFVELVDRRPFVSIGFERVRGVWLHWVLGFGLEGLHFTTLFLVGVIAGWYQVTGVASFPEALLILIVAIALAIPAAASEEITTRGYILQTLEEKYGPIAALTISSALFAILHGLNPGGTQWSSMLGLFLAGLYLGIAYLATRQLWYPIALHAIWNVCEGPIYGLPVSGMKLSTSILAVRDTGPALWTGGSFGPEAGIVVFLSTCLWAPLVWWAGRRFLAPAAAPKVGSTGTPREAPAEGSAVAPDE